MSFFGKAAAGMALAFSAFWASPGIAQAPPEPVIESVSVQPFDAATGRLGGDLLANPDTVVINGQIGDVQVREYLVTISIAGQPNLDLSGKVIPGFVRTLKIDIFENTGKVKTLGSWTKRLGAIPLTGHLHIPALVEASGCVPVTVRTTILGAKRIATKRVSFDLVCQN